MGDFGILGQLPTVNDIQSRINVAYDELFHYNVNGDRQAYVCTFCDEFLLRKRDVNFLDIDYLEKNRELFDWSMHVTDPQERATLLPLLDAYTFKDVDNRLRNAPFMQNLCLSPRGVIGRKNPNGKGKFGFSCCSKCKKAVQTNRLPFYAIVNRNFVGHAPACLKDLTEVELSFVSPVKGYGYCFKWAGGAQKCLKGSMTFMRVEERSIAQAAAKLQGLGLNNHIVILLSGKMTPEQRKKATQTIRVDKVLTAVQWLCKNNVRWQDIDYDEYQRELQNYVPTVIDQSQEVPSENQNLENEEVICCYYPDGAVNERDGGFNNPADFKEFIDKLHSSGYNVELQVNLAKTFVRGKDGDQLVNACLLHFPYGVAGLEDERKLPDGSITDSTYLDKWLAHLTLVSQPVFQQSMFQLVVYSLRSKLRLLRRSRMNLRSERTVTALANGLDLNSVRSTIRARQAGDKTGGTFAGRALIDAVECTSRALPHSNEAAKSARSTGESMQHRFGTPSIFLTVTPDDENSLIMQVLSEEIIDDDADVNTLSESELAARAVKRKELRLKCPGIGALNFEMILEIVMEHVIGWDMEKNCATDKAGLFGLCLAVAAAMEEQGRLSVHIHLSLWIKGFNELRRRMFFGNRPDQRQARKLIPDYSEHICSTELIGAPRKRDVIKALDHECTEPIVSRNMPEVVDEQGLRNLRHRLGYKENSTFATCKGCQKSFTYEDVVGSYCQEVGKMGQLVSRIPDAEALVHIPKGRMHALCVSYQKSQGASVQDCPSLAINAAYNSHASSHVHGCFKCQKAGKKRKHVCGCSSDCECRYRLPDRPRKKACIREVKEDNPWFEWTGNQKKQPIVEILPKRQTFDLFQNVSCKAITESKLTCNTNVSLITDGPIGQYQFKYIMKSTQEDDTSAYSLVEQSIKTLDSRVHQDDMKEASRLICRAAFAHNKKNVIGPALASYLTRHESRFYFSHDFQYVPLRDLQKAVNNKKLSSSVKYVTGGGEAFLENYALHYLCRPAVLEDLSACQFYEEYMVVNIAKNPKPGAPDMRFLANTTHFKHPSASKVRGNAQPVCRQGVTERSERIDMKICQWSFPDTARFKADILTCALTEINSDMETYAENILLLFHPFRSINDLILPAHQNVGCFPFVTKLRHLRLMELQLPIVERRVFTDRNLNFLQNVQNAAYNSLRYKLSKDDLQSVTECFKRSDLETSGDVGDDVEDDTADDDDEFAYELFLQECSLNVDPGDHDPGRFHEKLLNYSFKPLRNRGIGGCGNSKFIPQVDLSGALPVDSRAWVYQSPTIQVASTAPSIPTFEFKEVKLTDVVRVLLRKKESKLRPKVFKGNKGATVLEATGSFDSIQDWARNAGLDSKQKRAFESILAAFLLTFHDFEQDDYNDATLDDNQRKRARDAKTMLVWLKGGNGIQLVILLHGPGGSGKSTVIALVIAYAHEYCDLLGHPFTIRTIVVTALSGVAATLLHGETTHMSMGLNRKRVNEDMIDAWADTRLLIIDECSFASSDLFNKIQKNAQDLKQDTFRYFGGLNVVFAGDFSQLEPPCKAPIYEGDECPSFHGLLNAFVELDGRHRFKDDPAYGEMMLRFREGFPTTADITLLNEQCVISEDHMPPPNIPVAVYRNRNRDAINAAMFENFCMANKPFDPTDVLNSAVVVFMDELYMRDGAKTYVRVKSNEVKHYFYSNCGEDACKTGDMTSGRVDPVLKLFPGCRMMLTENKDVPNGQANGSRLTLKSVNVKPQEQPMIVQLFCGTRVRAYFASQILSFTMCHEVDDISPAQFDVIPKAYGFQAKVFISGEMRTVQMKGVQLPVISNGVTTGHKLQGCTLANLAVFELFYGQNWIYVVLSRVRTMKGLFLGTKLSEDLKKYAMSDDMKKMIAKFQDNIGLLSYSDDEYKEYSESNLI